MKYDNRELLEQLAAQYVVGTLRGRARLRFERVCASNEYAMMQVRKWEERMVGLASQVKPIAPPAHVWQAVERRLGFSKGKSGMIFGWSWPAVSALVFASVAAITIAIGLLMRPTLAPPQTIAVIAQADRGELWRVQMSQDRTSMTILATTQVAIDAAHAYELWALPDSGAAPISLGLLPTRGAATLTLSPAQRAALSGASKIAVSLEPPGGSPTGAPTGPVIHVANVTRLG